MIVRSTLLLWVLALAPLTAVAQEASPAAPTVDAGLSPICTDRPTKSNDPCTVDAGHFQYEADIANGTFSHQAGVTNDTWLFLNPTVKYGVSDSVDLEVNVAPLEEVRTKDSAGSHNLVGISDLYLRGKVKVLDGSAFNVQLTALPFVKAPTAKLGIGNGSWEGGVILPTQAKLSDEFVLTLDPEFDDLKNADGSGYHFNTNQLINIGYTLNDTVTLYAEIAGTWNYDPSDPQHYNTLDFAVTWAPTAVLQWDFGVNFGLNHEAPNSQVYVGVSQKF